MAYFYSERFLVEFSHDEVVHGKATIVNKMWGHMNRNLHSCVHCISICLSHPGKKLNFMGNDWTLA